jgi:4'-phosphopantetheinyl transferase
MCTDPGVGGKGYTEKPGLLRLDLRLRRDESTQAACLNLVNHELYYELSPKSGAFLHTSELSYFASLKAEKRKRDYLLGRYAAKYALAGINQTIAASQIDIRPGVFNQPVVMHTGGVQLSICITHSGRISAALAFPAGHPIGIDIEVIEPGHIEVLKGQVATDELPPATEATTLEERYSRVWTIKEALSKVLGCGLTVPFSVFRLSENTAWEDGVFTGGFQNFHQYRFYSIATEDFAFAIVHPGRTETVFDEHILRAFLCVGDGS